MISLLGHYHCSMNFCILVFVNNRLNVEANMNEEVIHMFKLFSNKSKEMKKNNQQEDDHCHGCGRRCPLSNPKCKKGKMEALSRNQTH